MKNRNNILLAMAVGSMLTACGGDDVTGTAADTTNNNSGAMNPSVSFDEMAPVITLNGSSNISILVNADYQDAGAFANDVVDGSVGVTKTGSVDLSNPGSYTVAYNAVDAAGNAANEVTRTVTVFGGTPIAVSQKLYGLEYDLYDGFEFSEVNINQSSISFLGGAVVNSAVEFTQGDLSYSAVAGQWVERNPAGYSFELVDLNTVGVVNGVRKLTIDSVQDLSGQLLTVGGHEIASDLPYGAARYSLKTEFLEDLYSVKTKISFDNVVAQTFDELLSDGCGDTDLINYIDSDLLTGASIPCNQIYQTEGTLTGNSATGSVANAGLWSIGKISGSEIDVLKITFNPSYLRAASEQLTEHPIFAIKDGEVWSGKVTAQGTVKMDNYYNDIAVQDRILSACFNENAAGNYVDC